MIFIVVFVMLLIFATFRRLFTPRKRQSLRGKHVVITGGSSGIGRSAAIIAAQKGANVTIIARNPSRLSAACEETKKARTNNDQIITALSVDVSNKQAIHKEIDKIESEVGPIFMLLNCAGMAICGKVEDFSEEDVNTLIRTNYLGTLYPIQSVVPKFKERKEGIIVLTASGVALMGMYGYSVYSSCKFALRGLAESLVMELKPYNVTVTLALPPDTDTPGFENENKTKPEETKLISASAGLFQPDAVAEGLIKDALIGNFFSYVGMESAFLTNLCIGMAPFASFLEVVIQSVILGPLRILGAYYLNSFDKIVWKCHAEREKRK